jgi:hypothetical protein
MQTMFIFRCVLLRLEEVFCSVCQPSFCTFFQEKSVLLLIILEKYGVILADQDEKCPGFKTIMNRFHTATNQHAKKVYLSLRDIAFKRNLQNRMSDNLLFIFPRVRSFLY